jgi:restriction system protein
LDKSSRQLLQVGLPWLAIAVLFYALLVWGAPMALQDAQDPELEQAFVTAGTVAALLLLVPIPILFWLLRRAEARLDPRVLAMRRLRRDAFASLIAEWFSKGGFQVEHLTPGQIAGVDLILRRNGERTLVSCAAWATPLVSAALVKGVFAKLRAQQAAAVKVVTTGKFALAATRFAAGRPLELITAEQLLLLGMDPLAAATTDLQTSFRPVPMADPTQPEPVKPSVEPDDVSSGQLATPTCPRCGGTMALRQAHGGGAAGARFWACQREGCKGMRPL